MGNQARFYRRGEEEHRAQGRLVRYSGDPRHPNVGLIEIATSLTKSSVFDGIDGREVRTVVITYELVHVEFSDGRTLQVDKLN